MLSHSANLEPEADAAVTPTSLLRKAAANRRRHHALGDVFGHFDGEFFRSWFIDGPLLLFRGKFSRREGFFIAMAAMPAILAAVFLTVPAMLFSTPDQQAFFNFAQNIASETTSSLPAVLGAISTLFCLRFPLGA